MSKTKHILLLTPGFASDEDDYLCIPAIQDFIRNFNDYRPDVAFHIVALHYPHKSSHYKWFDNDVISLGASGTKGPMRFVYRRRMREKINELIARHRIDAVHSLWIGEISRMGALFAKRLNVPHVVTVMGQDAKERKLIKSLKDTDQAVCLSTFQSNMFMKNGGKAHSVIPWHVYSSEPADSDKGYDIVGCGSFSQLKNWDLFLDIVAEIRNSGGHFSAVIFGDGPDRNRLENRIRTENLNVELPGNVSRNIIRDVMRKSSVFLHTSTYESFGMVLIEALEAGMIVYSSNVGAAKDIEAIQTLTKNENSYDDVTTDAARISEALKSSNPSNYKKPDPRSMVDAYALLYKL